MTGRILTLHPEGKNGVNISKDTYELFYHHIKEVLLAHPLITFTQLSKYVETALDRQFEGSIPWYTVSVKLDLEARGQIKVHIKSGKKLHEWNPNQP